MTLMEAIQRGLIDGQST
ncbi:unnamed protein product, partial [Adineta steineri]